MIGMFVQLLSPKVWLLLSTYHFQSASTTPILHFPLSHPGPHRPVAWLCHSHNSLSLHFPHRSSCTHHCQFLWPLFLLFPSVTQWGDRRLWNSCAIRLTTWCRVNYLMSLCLHFLIWKIMLLQLMIPAWAVAGLKQSWKQRPAHGSLRIHLWFSIILYHVPLNLKNTQVSMKKA